MTLRLISLVFLRSCFQRSFARRGYSVRLHHRSYDLIRQSVRILSTSDFNPYTKGLWHSRIVPAYLTDLPQFTPRLLPYMPSSLPRRAVLLLLSVSSQNASVFAQHVKARHPHLCPRHFHPACARRTRYLTRLQCSLYATACKVVRPTEMAPSTFVRVWVLLLPSFPSFGRPPESRI